MSIPLVNAQRRGKPDSGQKHGTEPSNTGIDSTVEVAVGTSGNVAICANTAITDGKGIDITIPDGTVKDALSHLSDKSPIMVAILDAGQSANDVDILNTTDVFQRSASACQKTCDIADRVVDAVRL